MSNTVETFVIGSGKPPVWVQYFMSNGIIQKIKNEDFEYYRINTPTGSKQANVGDVLIKTRSGVSVVPSDKAEKFKIVRKPQRSNDNKE